MKRIDEKPRPYGGPRRADGAGFVTPVDAEYDAVLRTSYEGFASDALAALPRDVRDGFDRAFAGLEAGGVFQYDVTQPMGPRTRCARTFVTRCLVGEPGITYKYLGTRMFAHPWCGDHVASRAALERCMATRPSADSPLSS